MIHFQLTSEEVAREMRKRQSVPRSRWIYPLVNGVLGLLVAYKSRVIVPQSEWLLYIGCMLLAFAILLLSFHFWYYREYQLSHLRRYVLSRPVLTAKQEVSFHQDWLHISSSYYHRQMAWVTFSVLTQDEQFFRLYSKHLGETTLLPKLAFDDANREEFLKYSQSVPRA